MRKKKDNNLVVLPKNVGEIQDLQLKLDVQKNLLLQKGLQSSDPEKIIEAARYFKDIEKRPESNIKSYLFDPWEFTHQFGFKDKPTSLSYDTLRKMGRTPIINSIITKRVEQVAAFTEPCFDEKSTGFIIRKKAGYFADNTSKTLSREDKAKISFITDFIINCGTDANSWHGDSFDTFLRKCTRDSLELDQKTFEVVRNRKGIPEEFIAVDAATMRLADSYDDDDYRNKNKIAINGYFPSYVQIFQMQPITDFYPWELCFGVRNHYTDVRLNGYGISELENLINIVTWMLYSDTYNGKFFSQGSAPKGILKVKGSINESRLQEFRQSWQSMIAGVQNCLHGDTIIYTKEFGGCNLESIVGNKEEAKATIWTGRNWETGLVYKTKAKKQVAEIITENSFIKCSPDHKFKILNDEGELEWKRQSEIKVGDLIPINKNIVEGDINVIKYKGQVVESDLFEILGWIIGDGCITYKTGKNHPKNIRLAYHYGKENQILEDHYNVLIKYNINVVKYEKIITEEQKQKLKLKYGFKTIADKRIYLTIFDSEFVKWYLNLGFNKSSDKKIIPPFLFILQSNLKCAFLRGFFSADGNCAKNKVPHLTIANETLREQTKMLLLTEGIKVLKDYKKEVNFTGIYKTTGYSVKNYTLFFEKIGFIQNHKQFEFEAKAQCEIGKSERVNYKAAQKYLRKIVEIDNEYKKQHGNRILTFKQKRTINDVLCGADGISMTKLIRLMDLIGYKLPEHFYNFTYSEVKSVKVYNEFVDMYDVSINNEEHAFMANGLFTSNSWKTPVIESDSLEYIDLHKNNREMEFSKWQEYLIKIACATYKIDPSEIGFPMNGSSSSQPMFEGNNEARLKYSKDSGLTPILKTWEHKLNKYVVKPIDPNFELKFVGMNPESEKDVTDLDIKKAASFMSLKEVRRKHNLPDLPEDEDDLILNPYYMQMMQAKQQEKMQGNQESNVAMNNENPFQGFEENKNNEQETNKGEVDPFTKSFNEFLEKSLK